ncbi:MAG: hypothetical protein OHK0029_17830 [Armatimonadaceae bacterium]
MRPVNSQKLEEHRTPTDGSAPAPRRRGRPRKADLINSGNLSLLRVHPERKDDEITLRFSGSLDLANLLSLRDAGFTAIGERPRRLILDLQSVLSVEISAINSLVTIVRVAHRLGVDCRVLPSTALRQTLTETGLLRLLPPPDADLVTLEMPEAGLDLWDAELEIWDALYEVFEGSTVQRV